MVEIVQADFVSESGLLVSSGGFFSNGLSVATALTAAGILIIGLILFVRGRGSSATGIFFTFTVSAAAWLGCFAMMYAASDATVALWWARAGYLPVSFLVPAAFEFVSEHFGRRHHSIRVFGPLIWIAFGALGVLASITSLFVPAVRQYEWGFYPVATGRTVLLVALDAAVIIPMVLLLLQAYRRSEGKAQQRAGTLLLAFILGSFGFVDFFPSLGIDIYPAGYTAVFAFVIVSAAALWREQLVDLTPEYASGQILETMKSAVLVLDLDGRIRVANGAACALLGYSANDLVGAHLRKILDPDENTSTRRLLNSSGVMEQAMVWRNSAGNNVDVLTSSSFVRDNDGAPVGVVFVASDYTERKRAEQRLRQSELRYRLLFERNLAGVYRSTTTGEILDCNEACARIFGFDTREELLAQRATSLYFDTTERDRIIEMLREQKALTNLELRMRKRDGNAVWVLENMNLLSESGGASVIEGTIIDITDRKYAQEQVEYQAYHDVLTGLPNRLLFRDRITIALAHARRTNRNVAVMFLDLDDFKAVNDKLGHTVGDHLLQSVAMRLVNSVRAEDTVARMGGDEFTVLLADVGDGRGAATVARKILESVGHKVMIDGHEMTVTTSIGLALFPGDGFDAEALLRNADRAMYRAKQLGRNNYQYATPPPFDDRFTLERRLKQALERNEFLLHYQPIVEVMNGRVVAAEALLRWNDPARGLLQPEMFIAAAEESDLVHAIGEWVLRTATTQMKRWHDHGHPKMRVSVNLSARQFQHRELPEVIGGILRETGLPPEYLDLEITESTAMGDVDLSLVTMRALKEMGVRISIDDFGTGHSSLSYLKRFPIDTVKIDQEFVRDLTGDPNDRAIITAVVSMARALRLRVIAEGVETQEQLEFLQREACAEMQGFLYSRPVTADDFEKNLQRLPKDDVGPQLFA